MVKIQNFVNGYRQLNCLCKNRWYLQSIAEDAETRFDTSNFEEDIPLPRRKNKQVTGLMKDELGGEIMKKFVGLREKTLFNRQQEWS